MRMIYDRNGNALQTIRGSLAASSTLLNAPDPYAVSLTDSLITVENSYDALNRLITTAQDPQGLNIIVTNEYDPAGNKTAVIDGKNQRTEFTYDGLNRNLSIKDPANESVRFLYDSINKVQRTDSLNQVTHYEYDARNRLAVVSYASSSPQNSDRIYNYDKVGNLLAVTKPAKGGLADVAYSYDSLNRPASETSSGQTHTYRYDLAGNRRQTTYGGTGRVLNSAYDALNRLTTLTEIVPAGSNRISQYHYDLSGNVRLRILPNSDVSLSHYDALNRQETRITARPDQSILHAYHYQYDLVGNVRFIDEEYPQNGLDNRTVLNSYDPVDRLISETITTASGAITTTYTFDNAHNRTQKATGSPGVPPTSEINYTYNNLNQMTSWTDGTKTVSHLYDRNGNQTLLSNGQYHWFRAFDFENRLIITRKGIYLHQPFEEYSYTYDYRTRRVVRDETMAGGVKTRLVFSGGTSVQEYTVNGTSETLAVEYIRGTDWGGGVGGILYTLRDSTPSFTHFNNRGDVVAKTDATGSLTYQAQYEAFGTRTAESGTTEDRQKANTKDEDPTGLLNEGFRYRDLETGTFITRDPLGFVDGPNMYAYVVQNPWTAFDPLGLQTGRKYTPAQLAAKRAQRERQAQAFKEYGGWKQVGSTGADFVPFVGTGKGGYETFTGKDPVTWKSLSGGERVVAGIGTVASVIPGGKLVVKGIGKAIAKGGDEAAGAVTTSARATQESTENTVDVYRSVGPAELADIDATRKFRVPEGGAEGKYFSTSQESVENYARDAEKAFGDPPYSTVKSQAPESAFTADSVSNIITDAPEAVVIPQKTLDRMVPEVIKRAEEPK
jgi:RHS repeat-associated protein